MTIEKRLKTIARNQQRIYDAGFAAGQAAGGDTDAAYNEGYDAGKQAEYDAFWDVYQENGNRTSYTYAFSGDGWTSENLRPKYDIKPTRVDGMFSSSNRLLGTDFTEMLEEAGVIFDTSLCTNFTNFAQYSSPRRFPTIDTRSATSINLMFCNASVTQVDKIILKEDGSQIVLNAFYLCNGLTSVDEIEGKIGNDFNIAKSAKLTNASIIKFVNALSSTSTGKTASFSKAAVNAAFTMDEWNALVATKPNWTITLA